MHWPKLMGGGPRVVVSTAAFHARVRGSVPGLGGLKETKMFLPPPCVKVSIVGSLRDREVACSASDRQGSNFESCVWRTVSSQSSHHPQEVLLTQFSLYVHKGGLKPDSFHFFWPKLTATVYDYNVCPALKQDGLVEPRFLVLPQNWVYCSHHWTLYVIPTLVQCRAMYKMWTLYWPSVCSIYSVGCCVAIFKYIIYNQTAAYTNKLYIALAKMLYHRHIYPDLTGIQVCIR